MVYPDEIASFVKSRITKKEWEKLLKIEGLDGQRIHIRYGDERIPYFAEIENVILTRESCVRRGNQFKHFKAEIEFKKYLLSVSTYGEESSFEHRLMCKTTYLHQVDMIRCVVPFLDRRVMLLCPTF